MGTTDAPRVPRARLPLAPFVPLLMVVVMFVGATLVAALVYPIVGTLGYGVGKVSDRQRSRSDPPSTRPTERPSSPPCI
jgi:hypothetical protein